MSLLKVIFSILLLNFVCSQQTAKSWANTWQANVLINGSVNGQWKYNYPEGLFYLYKEKSSSDQFCSTIFKNQEIPCYILVRDHNRYIVFPDKNFCCKCCTAKNGCDVLKPNWVTNLEFFEEITYKNEEAFEYKLSTRDYIESKEKQIPLRLTEGSIIEFKDYSEVITDANVFDMPSSCHDSCGFNTACKNIFPN